MTDILNFDEELEAAICLLQERGIIIGDFDSKLQELHPVAMSDVVNFIYFRGRHECLKKP